jgi:hypothetical protein
MKIYIKKSLCVEGAMLSPRTIVDIEERIALSLISAGMAQREIEKKEEIKIEFLNKGKKVDNELESNKNSNGSDSRAGKSGRGKNTAKN